MALPKVRKKPTNKELAGGVIEAHRRVNECAEFLNRVDNILGLYIQYNNHTEDFSKFVVDKLEEVKKQQEEVKDDTATNGEINPENIQANTKNKGSRTKRVRKKTK